MFEEDRDSTVRQVLDPESTALLERFSAQRLAEGSHPRSVKREISQLRSLAREAGIDGHSLPLSTFIGDLPRVAQVLTEPRTPIAASTGRARFIAIQRFIKTIGPTLNRDVEHDLAQLDALLPAKRAVGWHTTGTLVAGSPGRFRPPQPALNWNELVQLVDAAKGVGPASLGPRNHALVALHCFSGLRSEEVVRLGWEDLQVTPAGPDEPLRLRAAVHRGGRPWSLPIIGPAIDAIILLASTTEREGNTWSGPLFIGRVGDFQSLSYRTSRSILNAACRIAGLPIAGAVDLRAAFAYGLRTQGLSDHEVAAVLGIERVRTIDRLLRRHRALDAQRALHEILDQ